MARRQRTSGRARRRRSIYDLNYLRGNVEGGEDYDWYYADSNTDINNEDLDTANAFASNVFTAPSTGLYKVGYSLGWAQNGTNAPTSMHGQLLKNGAARFCHPRREPRTMPRTPARSSSARKASSR